MCISNKMLLYFVVLSVTGVRSLNVDSLITKANIYYQTTLTLGEPNEFALDDVAILHSKKDLKVIIHGFTGSRKHLSIKPLSNAYLANGFENVFLADWADAAGLDYHSSRKAVGKMAIFFGKMLNDFFNKHEIDRSEVHILGHSLGAHIAGGIGHFFNGSLGRVTGLDPALPLFTPLADDSLHATAAQFVDVIHTDFPIFGDLTPRGSADFYPNFGHAPQRGCDDIDLIAASKLVFGAYSCSHNRAVLLYAESIGQAKSFPAIPCSMNGIKLRSVNVCLKQWSGKGRQNSSTINEAIAQMDETLLVYVGEYVSRSATGAYYLETYDAPPYGMGVFSFNKV